MYVLVFIDDFSRFVTVYFLKAKDEVACKTVAHLRRVERQTGMPVKILRTDNGTEYVNKKLIGFFDETGILHQKSNAYTPQQNGVAERMNRTLVEKAKCLMFDADLPKCYWAEAMKMASLLINVTVTSSHDDVPCRRYYGVVPDISKLKLFGSSVMVHVPSVKRGKLDRNGKEMIFIGYDEERKGYRVADRKTNQVMTSKDVRFLGSVPRSEMVVDVGLERVRADGSPVVKPRPEVSPQATKVKPNPETNSSTEPEVTQEGESSTPKKEPGTGPIPRPAPIPTPRVLPGSVPQANPILKPISSSPFPFDDEVIEIDNPMIKEDAMRESSTSEESVEEPTEVNENPEVQPPEPTTRASAKTMMEKLWFGNVAVLSEPEFAFRCDEADHSDDPVVYEDVARRADKDLWIEAMNDEMNSLSENDTWELVQRPEGCRPIQSKWIFKTKRDSSGKIVRHKARLVARGFTQRYGIDYEETYSPVVRYTSVRMLAAYAAQHGMRIHQMDVVTAFLQGDVDAELYMEQPKGFDDGSGRVCKLKRSIYGLKQAGRQWNLKLDRELKRMGLKQSFVDPCVYFTADLSIIIGIYVDDFLIVYRDQGALDRLKEMLMLTFKMKDMGKARGCIGIRINQMEGRVELDQTIYVGEVLRRFGMVDCKSVKTPCDSSFKLSKDMPNEDDVSSPLPFQEAVGCLLFIAQATRPDISFAVGSVSRFNHCYTAAHWGAVKRIMRYLKGTLGYKLVYSSDRRQGTSPCVGFLDADWGSDVDTRRSVTGYVFNLYGSAIAWKSTMQKTIALSSTEAEYIAMSSTVQEAIWLKQMSDELGITKGDEPSRIFCDNQSAIQLAVVGGCHQRTRHIDIRYKFLNEYVTKGVVSVDYVSTSENVADAFTKGVTAAKLHYCNRRMGLSE